MHKVNSIRIVSDAKRLIKYMDERCDKERYLTKISGLLKSADKYFRLEYVTSNNTYSETKTLEYEPSDDGVLYVKIGSFYGEAFEKEIHALADLIKTHNITGIIFDLRNNAGGRLDNAVLLLRTFDCDKGIEIRGKVRQIGNLRGTETLPKPERMVVLVNGDTLSAAELVTLAFKKNAGAIIVGERTYGKSRIQNSRFIDKNIKARYTIGSFLVNGQDIEGIGIYPNVLCSNIDEKLQIEYDNIVKRNESFQTVVLFVQKSLLKLGFFDREISGIYDEYTISCVIRYKKSIGMNPNDYITETLLKALFQDITKGNDKQKECAFSVIRGNDCKRGISE